jgi:TonB-like protein
MPLLSLDLPKRPPALPGRQLTGASFHLTLRLVSGGSFPGRGLLYSFLIHEIAVFGLLFLSVSYKFIGHSAPLELSQMINLSKPREVVYLPLLGGGSEGKGRKGSGSGASRKGLSTAPAHSTKGFSYSGPQRILSDFPKPTNRIQTLLQPALENPPVLKAPVLLPNIVQMANAGPVPPFEPVKPMEPQPAAPPRVQLRRKATEAVPPPFLPNLQLAPPPIEPPKLILATSAAENPPPPLETKPSEPVARTLEKPLEPPRAEQFSPLATRGPDLQNLLALSPMPAPPEPSVKVPSAEARGRFAISPEPNLTASRTEPGSKIEGPPSSSVGIGNQTAASSGNAASERGTAVGAGGGALAGGGSGGAGTGAANGKGSGKGGSGADTGTGSGLGSGAGEGRGLGIGSGTGAGAGPGKGSFPGITIQGGRLETGTAGKPASHTGTGTPVPSQRSYGMTIVSTASSGGGFSDFGVFFNEQVYTVYIDMRTTLEDPAPSWTLQYAVLPAEAAAAMAAQSSSRSQDGLLPPFPGFKQLPRLPVELVQKYLHRLMVVYAIINTKGKLEQMSVKQSPDEQLNQPVLDALGKWVFRPAELHGQPVPVKVLLGIPLALPD